MGTPDFAVGTLKAIIEAGHDVAAVVTQPDKPKGRSKTLVFSPVKEEAVAHGITVLQPERARDEAFVEELRTYNADVIVVVAFGQLLPAMLKIWDADVADNISEVQTEEVKPGQVVTVGKNTFTIACGQGYLVVNEVQLEGKKRMDSGSFLRGNQLEAGVMLGE